MRNFLCIVSWLEGDDVSGGPAACHVEGCELWRPLDAAECPRELGDLSLRLGDAGAALQRFRRGAPLARADDVADQITLDTAEGYAWALEGEAERAFALLDRATKAVEAIDMVLAENVAYVERARASRSATWTRPLAPGGLAGDDDARRTGPRR